MQISNKESKICGKWCLLQISEQRGSTLLAVEMHTQVSPVTPTPTKACKKLDTKTLS